MLAAASSGNSRNAQRTGWSSSFSVPLVTS